MEIKCNQCSKDVHIGTPEFLLTLDYHQLIKCKELTEQMIKAKNPEKKVLLWGVVNEGIIEKWFAESDYLKAVEFLAKKAKEFSEKNAPRELEIGSRTVLQSEVNDYLGMKI